MDDALEIWEMNARCEAEGFRLAFDDPDRVIEWLKLQTPDTWHAVSESHNYDSSVEPLLWIVQQPEVDLGTLVNLFSIDAENWTNEPDVTKIETYYHAAWRTVKAAERKMASGIFGSKELIPSHSSDAASWVYQPEDLMKTGLPPAFHLPLAARGYEGKRHAVSDYMAADGLITWTLDKFISETGLKLKT